MANNDSKPSSLHMLQGIFFLIAFVVTILIISTDKNLQTDFGLVKPYFYHWYGLLTTGILSLIGGIVLIVKHDKMLEKVGVAGSAIIAIFLVADIATYSTTHWFPLLCFYMKLFAFLKKGRWNLWLFRNDSH